MSELLSIWKRLGEKEKCAKRFMEFISQPGFRFSRQSRAPVFRFFQCSKAFQLKELAGIVFNRFESELDDKNYYYYMDNFSQMSAP